MTAPTVDLSFPHHWQASILAARPIILPARHFVYPIQAEEVERGALEILIRPIPLEHAAETSSSVSGHDFSRAEKAEESAWALAPVRDSQLDEPFLATCALGFRDPAVPTGLWSTPNPDEICAVSGGYAYLISTTQPACFTMIAFRPVLEVRPLAPQGLLLFVGHHAILAWGRNGQAWQSEKLSSEGVTITSIEDHTLQGQGWDLMTDKETPFSLDLKTGLAISSARP